MQLVRALAAVILVAGLTSCAANPGPAEEGSFASQTDSTFAPTGTTDEAATQVTHIVPDASCPSGWTGLEVTTDSDAGVGDLDDIVACTEASGDRTYLENRSRVVWLLSAATVTPSVAVRVRPGLGETSFLRIVRESRGQEAMAPGSALTVNVGPEEVAWTPDLPLTLGWEGHTLMVRKLQDLGQVIASAALARQSLAGDALVACTLVIDERASSVGDLAGSDATKVVLAGLASSKCRAAAASAGVSDGLDRLRSDTGLLKAAAANIRSASASSLALPEGAQLLTR
jgi:hypothetical protein